MARQDENEAETALHFTARHSCRIQSDPIFQEMEHLCLHCLTEPGSGPVCPDCGGPVRAHEELFDLSIAHIDADAFYASVEKRDNPKLHHRPLIVGGRGDRGVVTTACYLARRYGVKSAMPMYRARKACPEAVIVAPDFARYREASEAIRARMRPLTPLMQTLSLDEAYLDLTGTTRLHGAPPAVMLARLAREVRDELGLTVSIGLSHAPYLAKIASDLEKPQGFTVIGRAETVSFLDDKPVGLIGGVGARMEQTLKDFGVYRIGDLRRVEPVSLYRRIGDQALKLIDYANGIDHRKIEPNPAAKSISAETTFERNTASRTELERQLWPLCEKVSARAKKAGQAGGTVVLKLKQEDHQSLSRQANLDKPTQLAEDLYRTGCRLLDKAPRGKSFRLIGIGFSELQAADGVQVQQGLFDDGSAKREAAERAIDAIRAKFGDGVAFKGRGLK